MTVTGAIEKGMKFPVGSVTYEGGSVDAAQKFILATKNLENNAYAYWVVLTKDYKWRFHQVQRAEKTLVYKPVDNDQIILSSCHELYKVRICIHLTTELGDMDKRKRCIFGGWKTFHEFFHGKLSKHSHVFKLVVEFSF